MKNTIAVSTALFGLLVLLPFSTSAHGHAEFLIGSKTYQFVVGSLAEPIAVDDKTGVDLRVTEGSAGAIKPTTGLDQTLKVELSAGDKKKVLPLSPAYNDPGAYRAHFIPTVQTTYTYRFFGTINDIPVDISFSCNPAGHPQVTPITEKVTISENVTQINRAGAFGCPLAKADLGFPEPSASVNDMRIQGEGIEAKARKAKTTAFAGLSLAVVAIGIALWTRTKKNA